MGFRPYLRWVGKNLTQAWTYFKYWKIWTAVLLGAFMQFVHNLAHNYVYYLAAEYGVYGGPDNLLTDLGFKAFANMPNLAVWPNLCLAILGVFAGLFCISPFFTDKCIRSPQINPLQILWRVCLVASITVTLRCISFLVTILPAPAPHCSQEEFSPPADTAAVFTYFDTGAGCSDLIFSSHVMYGLIAALAVHFYTLKDLRTYQPGTWERIFKWGFVAFLWVTVLWESIAIVRQETHYSIDVFGSLYAVPLTWIAFYHFFPEDPVPPSLRKCGKAIGQEPYSSESVEAGTLELSS